MFTWPIDFVDMFVASSRELSGARHCLNPGRHASDLLHKLQTVDRRRGWPIDCREMNRRPQGITLNER
jgi:hypothetical protein